jgi:hypothetical protein
MSDAFNAVKHYTVSASTTTAPTTIPAWHGNVRIVNASAGVLFWRADTSVVAATAADCAMLAGSVEVFHIDPAATNISIILIAGTASASVYFDLGYGV